MAKLFGIGKQQAPAPIPVPAAPPPAPTVDQASAQSDYADRLRKRRGFASTIVVPDSSQSLGGTAAVLG
jgi:hypothetical protein